MFKAVVPFNDPSFSHCITPKGLMKLGDIQNLLITSLLEKRDAISIWLSCVYTKIQQASTTHLHSRCSIVAGNSQTNTITKVFMYALKRWHQLPPKGFYPSGISFGGKNKARNHMYSRNVRSHVSCYHCNFHPIKIMLLYIS